MILKTGLYLLTLIKREFSGFSSRVRVISQNFNNFSNLFFFLSIVLNYKKKIKKKKTNKTSLNYPRVTFVL